MTQYNRKKRQKEKERKISRQYIYTLYIYREREKVYKSPILEVFVSRSCKLCCTKTTITTTKTKNSNK